VNSPILPVSLPDDPGPDASQPSPNEQDFSGEFSEELQPPFGHYLTQIDVNHVLSNLFDMLAANEISCKRASTLAYICANLLKSQEGMRTQLAFMEWYAYDFVCKALHERYGAPLTRAQQKSYNISRAEFQKLATTQPACTPLQSAIPTKKAPEK